MNWKKRVGNEVHQRNTTPARRFLTSREVVRVVRSLPKLGDEEAHRVQLPLTFAAFAARLKALHHPPPATTTNTKGSEKRSGLDAKDAGGVVCLTALR